MYDSIHQQPTTEETMQVYKAINAVQAELATIGIVKDKRNSQGAGYNFRGIDDVYNAIAPLLAKHGLCILPRVLARECVERQSKNGGALFYITVEAEFDFVSSEDGTKHTVKTFGEAMDSGDKATNKAMSAAYKYACFQAFSIPTESRDDADYQTHEVMPPTITAEQAIEIDELIESTKSDRAGLLNWVSKNTNTNCADVSMIPNVAYVHVKKMLTKKAEKVTA
jgi:hypothetical protein